MKTIIINASPRKNWNTAQLLKEAQKGALTPDIDRDLNLGIAMLHFAAVAKQYIHNIGWTLTKDALDLPAGVTPVASCQI